ncbi:MAG: hypothetical protein ABI859_00295 [Pseudomonadota bacterium]
MLRARRLLLLVEPQHDIAFDIQQHPGASRVYASFTLFSGVTV